MPEVNSAVQDWLADHARRGCSPVAMVDAMVQVGFEQAFADEAVHQALQAAAGYYTQAHYPHGFEALNDEYRYDPVPVAAGNVIRAHDRDIEVLVRCDRPQVIVFGNVLSADECAALIERAQPKLKRSTTVNPESGAEDIFPSRTSEGAFFQRGEDPFILNLEQRIAALMNWPVENGEGFQVLNYRVGAEYTPHFDYFPPQQAGSAVHTERGGNRVATMVLYLNDVPNGGATYFPEAGISVAARQGRAVYFRYMNGYRQLDPLSLHGGAPVLVGEKWIMTKWVRERAAG
ncbi:MAG: 2OG-Fe(II) oxygenase [Paraburkholderia sp.]|uniref:2OG-Fe(II) oxygenase n=1 Tax=Paraburkholderia sp. TaxID=1926495 RepID=UPI003C36E65F